MKTWTEKYNELPDDIRKIANAVSCKDNIQYLNIEKARLIKRHKQSLAEINDHIKNHESWYREHFKQEEL